MNVQVPRTTILLILLLALIIYPGLNSADDVAVLKQTAASETTRHFYFQTLGTESIAVPHLKEPGVNADKHSVLLIVMDALNASHLGAYGYPHDTTPNIDAMAEEGVLFTDWISNSSWTRPSFTTILTGVPKSVHGMELTDKRLPAKIKTLAKIFRRSGFRTAAFVGNPLIQKKWRYNQGFDVFKDTKTFGDFPPAEKIIDEAIGWIGQKSDKPYLAVLFLTDTHAPYAAPMTARHFSAKFKNIITDPAREVVTPLSKTAIDGIIAAYDDELRYADMQIGRLFHWLKLNGLYDDSAIVLTADHGEIFGAHNCFQHAYHMWEPVLRVPFIVKAPTLTKTGRINNSAGHLDTMPTVMHLAGISNKTRWGRSVFAGQNQNSDGEKIIVSAYDARGVKRQAARMGTMKLVRYEKVANLAFGNKGKESRDYKENLSLQIPGPRYELYDLKIDPNEQNNIFNALQNSAVVDKLKKAVKPKKAQQNKKKSSQSNPLDDEILRALKAGGYIR